MRISDWSSDVCSSDLMLTQRLALLAAPLQKVVYDELFDAYRDAVIEKEIEDGSADVFDWRAKTVDVSKAWGPDRDLSLMSAFDSPVYQIGRASCRERVCQYV